jgi:hypothetical protein
LGAFEEPLETFGSVRIPEATSLYEKTTLDIVEISRAAFAGAVTRNEQNKIKI